MLAFLDQICYISIAFHQISLSLVYSGGYFWYDGAIYGQGGSGHWWPYTGATSSDASHFAMYSSTLTPQINANRAYGLSLRRVDG